MVAWMAWCPLKEHVGITSKEELYCESTDKSNI